MREGTKYIMIVTVSDTNGIKQYNVNNHIKKIILIFLFIIIFVIGGLSFYIKTLHTKLFRLEKNFKIERSIEKKRKDNVFEQNKIKQKKLLQEKIDLDKIKKEKQLKLKIKQEALLKAEKIKIEKENVRKKEAEKSKIEEENRIKEKKRKEILVQRKKIKKEKEKRFKEKKRKEALDKEKKRKKEKKKKANKNLLKSITKKEKLLPVIAKSKLGRRYVWGAVGPGTFDCSGFTSYVYKKTGINIPRTSRQQSKYGKLVDRKHLRPGDLIFFDTSRARRGYVNHVGMYIGNNQFIHASSAKKRVVITNLKNFYSQRFKWARRVIN